MTVTAVPLQPIAKGSLTKLWVGLALVVLGAILLAWLSIGPIRAQFQTSADYLADIADDDGVQATDSGLLYRVIREGEGDPAGPSDVVTINYEGRFRDGTVFDQAERAPFPVGATVPGFDEALQLAPVGSKLELWIPPELGYGSEPITDPQTGQVVIPGDSVLNFEFEVLDIRSRQEVEQMMEQQRAAMEALNRGDGGQPGAAPTPQ